MAEVIEKRTDLTETYSAGAPERLLSSPSNMSSVSANNSDAIHQLNVDSNSDEDAPKQRQKRRIQQFSDSDSDREVTQNVSKQGSRDEPKNRDSDSDDAVVSKSVLKKSRILKSRNRSSSDSDSDASNSDAVKKSSLKETSSDPHSSDSVSRIFKSVPQAHNQKSSNESSDSDGSVKYGQQMRMKNKRNKMKNMFKSLINSREKEQSAEAEKETNRSMNSSDSEDNEAASSIEKIKQKIKERMSYKPSICDPDTSDEEAENSKKISMPKHKEKRTKLTSPKPQRMSAKQAMENMQKIKSESNRMLREKEVSLPYHRPKALTLKDIMSRRKPAMSSDGKCLPIKMNGEQLKQYAQMLEDRQKQMMELWKSDTDEENDGKKSDDEKLVEKEKENEQEKLTTIDKPKNQEIEAGATLNSAKQDSISTPVDISAENDRLFDVLSQSIEIEKNNVFKDDENNQVEPMNNDIPEEQDSETNMKLVFNESETSITEDKQDTEVDTEHPAVENIEDSTTKTDEKIEHHISESAKLNTETDSQLISLHYDSEKVDTDTDKIDNKTDEESSKKAETVKSDGIENIDKEIEAMDVDGFSDDDMNIADIDSIIENAEIIRDFEDKVNSQVLIRDRPLNLTPKLTGAPGMVIDLDDSNALPKKSGVELLKERFTFFAKLKTPDELERAKERQIKPGNQHSRLKHELEEQMAEQRSLEWARRLEDDKQQQKELRELRGEESDDENDIDKIEAKLEEENVENEPNSSDSEEGELLEDDVEMKDKPRAKNPMLENEAQESDCDDNEVIDDDGLQNEDENEQENAEINGGDDEDNEESSEDSESSESEDEQPSAKKGRILKAFEDSDDEDTKTETKSEAGSGRDDLLGSQVASQDDVLPLAQRQQSASEDLFTSQASSLLVSQKLNSPTVIASSENDVDLGTQTFSILDSTKDATADFLNAANGLDKVNAIGDTRPYLDNLDPVVGTGSFSQSLPPLPITQFSQSQPIGEDILALCTGKFYENEFISQVYENQTPLGASQEYDSLDESQIQFAHDETQNTNVIETETVEANDEVIDKVSTDVGDINTNTKPSKKMIDDNLKSILDELDDPEFDTPRPNKFFCGATQRQIETQKEEVVKKKLIIDSDDDDANASETKKKKLKKKKPEMRALQISDDEEEEMSEMEEYESEIEEENEERVVEYDSEENEVEVKPQNQKLPKKKRKGTEFFEQEAELTSEDEWAGSGDEDEAGLDRMEREAGDDESFHQGRLQRELGQIHMREVIDQDKREVRIIQELLFEDGDLGAGGRQRKFKWKNLDGDEETGTGADEFKDTQEEEFESEEQWRKQRHERETFLRQMQNDGELDDCLNVSINRTTIIKANLMSKTMSTLLAETLPSAEKEDIPVETEKKTKDIPSSKKHFSILQQSYQGSILNRGRGALARLAALATPLAVDDDAPKGKSAATSNRRNFVFATLTPEPPKVTKRKAEVNLGTPALVKKMKTEDKQKMSKSRLLDHMKV